jgi:hypothetical protein
MVGVVIGRQFQTEHVAHSLQQGGNYAMESAAVFIQAVQDNHQ